MTGKQQNKISIFWKNSHLHKDHNVDAWETLSLTDCFDCGASQLAFICSNLTIETTEHGVIYVQC